MCLCNGRPLTKMNKQSKATNNISICTFNSDGPVRTRPRWASKNPAPDGPVTTQPLIYWFIIYKIINVNCVWFSHLFCICHPGCTPNPCKNGGTCYLTSGATQCACPPGLKGYRCAEGMENLHVYSILHNETLLIYTPLVILPPNLNAKVIYTIHSIQLYSIIQDIARLIFFSGA